MLWLGWAAHPNAAATPLPSTCPAGLVLDLREVPSKAALQLRSDVAQTLSTAQKQYNSVEKMVSRLAKQGL